jgi:hypothetical protein
MTKPLPTDKERWRLLGKLQKQVNKLHGKDDDGDRYATVKVQDWRDGQWPYIRPVPRVPWDSPTPEQLMEAIDAAGSNVESTSRMFDQVRRDVQMYFETDKRGRAMRDVAKAILGKTAIVGQAYEKHDDAPRWCQWHAYKALHAYGQEKPTMQTCFFNDVNGFDPTAFKTWLKAGKCMLVKAHGKRIKRWYVRTDGSVGTSLSALVETPEKDRPYHTARNLARRKFLDEHVKEIEQQAVIIEAEIRAKGKK